MARPPGPPRRRAGSDDLTLGARRIARLSLARPDISVWRASSCRSSYGSNGRRRAALRGIKLLRFFTPPAPAAKADFHLAADMFLPASGGRERNSS